MNIIFGFRVSCSALFCCFASLECLQHLGLVNGCLEYNGRDVKLILYKTLVQSQVEYYVHIRVGPDMIYENGS